MKNVIVHKDYSTINLICDLNLTNIACVFVCYYVCWLEWIFIYLVHVARFGGGPQVSRASRSFKLVVVPWWSVAYVFDGVIIMVALGGEDPLASMGEEDLLVNASVWFSAPTDGHYWLLSEGSTCIYTEITWSSNIFHLLNKNELLHKYFYSWWFSLKVFKNLLGIIKKSQYFFYAKYYFWP